MYLVNYFNNVFRCVIKLFFKSKFGVKVQFRVVLLQCDTKLRLFCCKSKQKKVKTKLTFIKYELNLQISIFIKKILMEKIHVYFMPGLAASPTIFERIKLPENQFEIHLLEWFIPKTNESLKEYAQKMANNVSHKDAILVGVSFGGILVQEMKAFLNPQKVIIISSVKSNKEFPRRMKIAKTTKAYKLIPMSLFQNIENLAKYAFGDFIKQRVKLYEKFLSVRDKNYLNWAIENVILWERTEIDKEIIHIHGLEDEVFPVKYIKNYIPVKGGTHIMILNRYKWLNENLPKIMLDE
jgi:uncharacterized membrane protein